ncbi:hypothetical protein SNEBB_000196 [Seison nebaliae]|nr:hypothetical protein SNEBB_000196 [Seison nebaliae]
MIKRIRQQYCKVIIATSLCWLILDACILLYLADCSTKSVTYISQKENNIARLLAEDSDDFVNDSKETKRKNTDTFVVHRPNKRKAFRFLKETSLMAKLSKWAFPDDRTNPPDWPGENGVGVTIRTDQQSEQKRRFSENQFNILASEMIALNRSIPDQRQKKCRSKVYDTDLPSTSIIIVFHNEANSTLRRTLTSIVNRSPVELIKEIILVDDASVGREYLNKPLEEFLGTLPVKTTLIHLKKRSGLIRARLKGAGEATGSVLTFLDAHIECSPGWLEPLLHEVKKNRRAVACPIIDVISDDNFAYLTGSDLTYGGFNWKMGFRWFSVPNFENKRRNNDRTMPMRSPAMAGGLFCIDRTYFYEIGSYDSGMEVWGAENVEMSLRIWMCGGELLIVTCSHVGHIFRKQTPYTFPGGTSSIIYHNTKRLIDVWGGKYKEFFYSQMPELKKVDAGDISERLDLQKKLKCKNFEWYIENVFPNSQLPLNSKHVGQLKHDQTSYCLDSMGRKQGESIGMISCHEHGGNQILVYSNINELVMDGLCLDVSSMFSEVKLMQCHKLKGNQEWLYLKATSQLRHIASNQCLTFSLSRNKPTVDTCSVRDARQKFLLDSKFEL